MNNNNTIPAIKNTSVTLLGTSNQAIDSKEQKTPLNQPVNENFWPFPKYNSKGALVGAISHMENLKYLLDSYGISVRYNVITKEQELSIPEIEKHISDNSKGHKLELIKSLCDLNRFPSSRVQEQIMAIANSRPRNPVIDYATSKPWDKKNRFGDVCDTITVDGKIKVWRDAAVIKFLIAAVCLAINDEQHCFSVKAILVFQGAQGLGKTPWIRILTGELRCVLEEGHLLNPESKDSVSTALKNWIVELGELDATTKKADVAALKAFITKHTDTIRLPYAAEASTWSRRTAFFGTVNPSSFLIDNTGNDRYWALPVLKLNLNALDQIDKQQLWAQAYEKCKEEIKNGNKEPWALTEKEKHYQVAVNESFRLLSPIEESITEMLSNKIEMNLPRIWQASLLDICDLAGFKKSNLSAKDKASAKTLLEFMLGEPSKYCGKRGWAMPDPDGYHKANLEGLGLLRRKEPCS
tara:strand:- start:7734 stop:9134 length:1401 start_codon:yes stop_codon:yes gene_type:complete